MNTYQIDVLAHVNATYEIEAPTEDHARSIAMNRIYDDIRTSGEAEVTGSEVIGVPILTKEGRNP